MEKALQEHQTHALPNEDRTQKLPKFKGIRLRKWGSWGSEIRMPKSREKIWLGSYKTVEQAARAYDAAVYCLRGPNAKFNFSGSVPAIPSAFSLSRQQIQVAAAKYALDQIPSTSPSLNNSEGREREEISLGSPSRSSSVSERELWSDSQQISEERVFWESLFDSGDCLNFQKFPSIDDTSVLDFIPSFPSIDDTSVLDFIPSWQEEEQQDGYISVDLWNF